MSARRSPRSGRSRDDLAGGRPEPSGQDVGRQLGRGSVRRLARSDRTVRRRHRARPRRAGSSSARRASRIRAVASSRNRETPTPAVPLTRTVRGLAVGGVVEARGQTPECVVASHESLARVPRGHDRILGLVVRRGKRFLAGASGGATVPPRSGGRLGWAGERRASRPVHPANELNELPGEEWLYFTKSLLTTAYPSELGHATRRVHGANKPPRLMARLIEFFSRTGEPRPRSVRGGRRHAPRRGDRSGSAAGDRDRARAALGDGLRERRPRHHRRARRGRATSWRTSERPIPAGSAASIRRASASSSATRRRAARRSRRVDRLRRDRSAVQRPAADDDGRRCPGRNTCQSPDRLRDGHRFTGRSRQRAGLRDLPRSDAGRLRRASPRPPRWSLRCRHRSRRVPGRPIRLHRVRSRGRGGRRRPRPERRPHLVPGRERDFGRTATRGRSSRTSSTNTCWCSARRVRPVRSSRRRASR